MTSRTVLVTAWLVLVPTVVSAQERERVEALIGLARVKRDAGDARAAAGYFEAAREVRPLDASETAEYFWCLADTNAERARAIANEVLTARPADRDVRARAIALAVATEDEAAVRELASAGERAVPGVSLWPRRLGESYLREGQPAEAREAFARAVRTRDASDPDWAGFAVALEATGDSAAALDAWNRVAPGVRFGRGDWGRSYLRALASAGPVDDAAAALNAWLVEHPHDVEARGLLVETWARAGQPGNALAAMADLTTGSDRAHWIRREAELADEAGDRGRAIRAYERLVRTGEADLATLWALAELMVETGMFDRAARNIEKAARTAPCDERVLALYDRFPDPNGAERLLDAIDRRPQRCLAAESWTLRAALRAAGRGRPRQALDMVERQIARGERGVATRALQGRLLLWSGQPTRAAEVLEAIVAEHRSPETLDALSDAYRATGRPWLAWDLAAERLEDASLSDQRRLDLAALAIEADHPDRALDIALALEDREPIAARLIAGRALAALGRPAEALDVMRAEEEAVRQSPEATLAFADAVAAMHGAERALETVRAVPADGPHWIEVHARRALWEAVAGDRQAAQTARDRVADLDSRRAQLVDAEIALAERQPAAALEVLGDLLGDARAADLESVALAGVGDYRDALRLLERLHAERPRFVPFTLRQAEWAWRATRTHGALAEVVELAQHHASRADAQVMAARALSDDGQFERALDVLGGDKAAWERQPLDGLVVAARALRALGRQAEALEVVSAAAYADPQVALLHAELTSAVHGATAAGPLFEALAASARGGPSVYLAWSAVQPSPRSRQAVLTRATARFPNNLDLLTALAGAAVSARDWPVALEVADQAIALDLHAGDAWIARIDAAVHLHTPDLDRTLDRFSEVFGYDTSLVIGMAERIAQLSRSEHDPLVVRATRWLDGLSDAVRHSERALIARARVLAASERWGDALDAVHLAREAYPDSVQAHRLEADLLAFSGRHREALDAYEAYLERAPLDLEAARLRARVSGWAGDVDTARKQYFALVTAHPEAVAIAAEALAKDAFHQARWREAVPAYERWLLIEPDSREAAFELAQSKAALGDVEGAARLLHDLDTDLPVHRFARAASDRLETARRPSAEAYGSRRTSNGYDGLRLLEVDEQGGMFSARLGASLPLEFGAAGGSIAARASGVERSGYRATAFGGYRLSPSWHIDGHLGLLDFTRGERPLIEGRAVVTWRPTDRWSLFGGVDRSAVLENLATVDAGLSQAGGVAGFLFESRATTVELAGGRRTLSDDNGVVSATLTASHRLTRGTHEVRLVGWGWYVAFDQQRGDYFSPASFMRADAGLEWSWWFERPRFRGDRERRLAVGYLIGTDSEGVLYHHPSARVLFELPAGIALEAGADWIRSDVYRESSVHVGVRVGAAPQTLPRD